MNPIITMFIVIANAPSSIQGTQRARVRVRHAREIETRYPYVVALVHYNTTRQYTGTLISPEWVLTAAHCIDDSMTHIQYGNMSTRPELSRMVSKVIERIPHPGYRHQENEVCSNDIGLCRVNSVTMNGYGKISAIDYRSLMGYAVMYIGYTYGNTGEDSGKVYDIPLYIKEGMVSECTNIFDEIRDITLGPYLCIAPKCSDIKEDTGRRESGGPLFYDGRVIGVLTGGLDKPPLGIYTAISPFLTWIHKRMFSPTPPKGHKKA